MKTTQEAINWAKAFDENLQALRTGIGPALRFLEEQGDRSRTMVELAEMIPDRANAYA